MKEEMQLCCSNKKIESWEVQFYYKLLVNKALSLQFFFDEIDI